MTIAIRSRLAIPCALVVGAMSLAASLAFSVPSASAASGPANAEASELVRLINGARGANGLAALRLDPFLAGLARDTPMSCPSDASLVMLGRARDGAENNWAKHELRPCPSVKFVSILQSTYKYWNVGEIMLQNRGYGTGRYQVSYKGSRATYSTFTYSTSGHGLLGWMGSSSHAPIILGSYDRVGCGGWIATDSTFWYDCIVSKGGPRATTAPPTRSPFGDPAATTGQAAPVRSIQPAAAAKVRPGSVATSQQAGTSSPKPGSTTLPTTAASATIGASPTAMVLGANSAASSSGPVVALPQAGQGAGNAADIIRPFGGPTPTQTNVGLASGLMAMLTAVYGLLFTVRKRRRRGALPS